MADYYVCCTLENGYDRLTNLLADGDLSRMGQQAAPPVAEGQTWIKDDCATIGPYDAAKPADAE